VGLDRPDDAGVYLLRDDLALVQTVDVITPIADDPVVFGRIAATNAMSDVYAMGGTPVTALSIVAFPVRSQAPRTFTGMLEGGMEALRDAGAVLVGGHSIDDPEIKLGFSVTGVVDPGRIITKAGASTGDLLVLTKALGTGLVSTALKKRKASDDAIEEALVSMCRLNDMAAGAAVEAGVIAGTDVTGFGLLGHLREIVVASGVDAEVDVSSIPLLTGARAYADQGLAPGGTGRNREFVSCVVDGFEDLDGGTVSVLCDPQTSGGLLLAVPEGSMAVLRERLEDSGTLSAVVGRVTGASDSPRIRLKG